MTKLQLAAVVLAVALVPAGVQAQEPFAREVQDRAVPRSLVPAQQIARFRGPDTVWNGVAIGALAGGATMGLIMTGLDGGCGCSETAGYVLLGGVVGGGVGAGIDALLSRKPSKASPNPRRRIDISPLMSRDKKGMVARVGF